VWHGEVADCIHQNHIFRVRAREDLLPDYLSALVASQRGKRYFLRAAKQTTGIASINMTQLKAFPALVPPRELQVRYLACAEMTRRARDRQSETQRELDVLFENLSRSAFRGELIAS
jgi:type I restriction enzyme S subunit